MEPNISKETSLFEYFSVVCTSKEELIHGVHVRVSEGCMSVLLTFY